jgi:hypothetical protein
MYRKIFFFLHENTSVNIFLFFNLVEEENSFQVFGEQKMLTIEKNDISTQKNQHCIKV